MFCPDCGTWNRARAVRCMRCNGELPELSDAPRERPEEELSALRLDAVLSYDAEVDEGPAHSGMSALIDVVARRPA